VLIQLQTLLLSAQEQQAAYQAVVQTSKPLLGQWRATFFSKNSISYKPFFRAIMVEGQESLFPQHWHRFDLTQLSNWHDRLTNNENIYLQGPDLSPEIQNFLLGQVVNTLYVFPCLWEQSLHGFILLTHSQSAQTLQPELMEFLTVMARSIAAFEHKNNLAKGQDITLASITSLHSDLSFALTQSADLKELITCSAEAIAQHLNIEVVCIWLKNHRATSFELQSYINKCLLENNNPEETFFCSSFQETLVESIANSRQPYIVNNPEEMPTEYMALEGMAAFAGYPLMVKERVVGVMMLASAQSFGHTTFQVVASVTEQLSLGIAQKQAIQHLKHSKQRYQAIVEDQTELICRFSKDGTFTFVNQAFCNYFELPRNFIDDKQCFLLPSQGSARYVHDLTTRLELDAVHPVNRIESSISIRGKTRWLQWTYRLIQEQNEDGIYEEIQAIGRDITDLVVAREKALETAEAKTNFLSTMSHEIRTPLNGIVGTVDILRRTHLIQPNQKKYFETLVACSKNLGMIVNDILDLSKLEAHRVQLENIHFNLEQCLEEVKAIVAPSIENKKLDFRYYLGPHVPKFLKGDPLRLQQCLVNLVSNAIKFTNQGFIEIVVKEERHDADLVDLKFSVQDTGMGISLHQQKNLFQAFSQADSSISRRYGGTGLGLSITAELVKLMKGNIGVETVEGAGSTFWFVARFDTTKQSPIADFYGPDQSFRSPHQSRHNLQVLLVEDTPINQEIIAQQLKILGYEPTVANHGLEAIALVAEHYYDLILMDCMMPHMSGQETTKIIRERQTKPSIIVALTATATPDIYEQCLQCGMDGYVTKPVTIKELQETIDKWFPLRNQYPFGTEPMAAPEGPDDLINWEQFDNLAGNNKEFQRHLLDIFVEEGAKYLENLEQAIAEQNLDKIIAHAHRLKGAASMVAITPIVQITEVIETQASQHSPSQQQSLVTELHELFEKLQPYIKNHHWA
jgi:PAS domain S-box-containing protein